VESSPSTSFGIPFCRGCFRAAPAKIVASEMLYDYDRGLYLRTSRSSAPCRTIFTPAGGIPRKD
jgi:hypothetical protein